VEEDPPVAPPTASTAIQTAVPTTTAINTQGRNHATTDL
jgi:hypothetical protein